VIIGYAVGITNITNHETLQWMHKPHPKKPIFCLLDWSV